MSVKEKKRGRPAASTGKLNCEAIITQAKILMQSKGKMPSIRALATSLNVDAMAIYYYFDNKNALLEAITVSLIQEIYQPKLSANWQVELKQLCLSYLTLLKEHPGLLETLLGMTTHGPVIVFIKRFHTAVAPLNLSEALLKSGLDLLVDYLHGVAFALNCSEKEVEIEALLNGPFDLYATSLTLISKQ